MEIKITFKNRVFLISVGKNTPHFSQMYWIVLTELFYRNMKIDYAKLIWHS